MYVIIQEAQWVERETEEKFCDLQDENQKLNEICNLIFPVLLPSFLLSWSKFSVKQRYVANVPIGGVLSSLEGVSHVP